MGKKRKKYTDPYDGELLGFGDLVSKYKLQNEYHSLASRLLYMSVKDALETRTQENNKNTKIRSLHKHMIRRCTDPLNSSYPKYGAVGIRVCERWSDKKTGLSSFALDMGPRPPGHQIDRIDATQGYSPENCRWVTVEQQIMNRRPFKTNKSGFKGVHQKPKSKKWRAMITFNRIDYVLGLFENPIEAAQAYDNKAKELFGEHAYLNFPIKK